MFLLPRSEISVCSVTNAKHFTYNSDILLQNALFLHNEAVACRGGLTVVNMSPAESAADDCAVITGFIGWRSGHIGIMTSDAEAQLLIAHVLLAENHIGISLHSYKETENLFNGIVASTIIGSLSSNNVHQCADLPDSVYKRAAQCQAFSTTDPLGLLTNCNSVISGIYRRVGILLPQWTNKPKTCAISGSFAVCEPPNTPDRLCLLPWDNRYALPVDIAYAEQHIHDTTFLGFHSYSNQSVVNATGQCIPSPTSERSVAIATNPSQVDMQPTVIMSGLRWSHTDVNARFGFDVGAFGSDCVFKPCNGQNMILLHDLDGSANSDH